MTASSALFMIDTLLVVLFLPPSVWLAAGGSSLWAFHALILAASDLLFFYALGLYRRDAIMDISKSLGRVPLVVAMAIVAACFAIVLLDWVVEPTPATSVDLAWILAAAMLCLTLCGIAARLVFAYLRNHSVFRTRLLVVGAGERSWDLLWILRSQGQSLQYDVTFVHDPIYGPVDPRLERDASVRIVSATDGLLEVARKCRADEIVVAPDERRGMALEALITCKTAGYPVQQYMTFLEHEAQRIDVKRLDFTWFLYSDGFSSSPLDRLLKRLLDVCLSLLILAVFLPILVLAMVAIWLEDRGEIFYRQERVTQGGRKFQILKLRTMRMNAESNGAVWAAAKDSRITRIGSFLRRSRIDELPQLLNVLSGDMSLVGPRPERPEFIAGLITHLPLYQERHAVKAGLTGWAQVNYPYGASLDDARSKLSYDLYYVKNSSLVFDLMILVQTLRVVVWPGSGVR